ncbi:hypothetical protein Ahy_A02g008755 isoform C [Arachis hypogaea]|uniref:Uncharacterized protein n=1 Tax=Arachis hypogaea TaxID=3818 RepID=A0A445EFV1_ARAHY|nr:hypothetical protein Ahy_A02g008755 isoform C [Arachis hypogaea]
METPMELEQKKSGVIKEEKRKLKIKQIARQRDENYQQMLYSGNIKSLLHTLFISPQNTTLASIAPLLVSPSPPGSSWSFANPPVSSCSKALPFPQRQRLQVLLRRCLSVVFVAGSPSSVASSPVFVASFPSSVALTQISGHFPRRRHALGGFVGSTMVSTIEVFDPRREAWITGEPMNHPRREAQYGIFNQFSQVYKE